MNRRHGGRSEPPAIEYVDPPPGAVVKATSAPRPRRGLAIVVAVALVTVAAVVRLSPETGTESAVDVDRGVFRRTDRAATAR
jgi:hypothetical protein